MQDVDNSDVIEHLNENDNQNENDSNLEGNENKEQIEIPEVKDSEGELPQYAKERLGRERKRHDKEIRNLKQQLYELQTRTAPRQNEDPIPPANVDPTDVKGQVLQALSELADKHSKEEEKRKYNERLAHVESQYMSFQDKLDAGSDIYEDFDEVVRNDRAPFTTAMRDAGMLIDNPAEVFYVLGKNRKELKRIAGLHPLEQGREIVKLSANMLAKKPQVSKASKPLESLKSNPAARTSTSAITTKSTVSEIRKILNKNNGRR